MSATT